MTFFQNPANTLLKLRVCRRNIINIFCHHSHDPGYLCQLLCHCQPAFDHAVAPYQILFFLLKTLSDCFQILYGFAADLRPLLTDHFYSLLIPLFHGADHCLSALLQRTGIFSPAYFSVIASAAHFLIGILQYRVNLTGA